MKKVWPFLLAICVVFFTSSMALAGEGNISVAASLKDVLNDLTAKYAEKNPGVRFLRNYGGSGGLAMQIENGAPADIFISASPKWMEYLEERKLMDVAGIGILAHNSLVVAGATGKVITSMQDLTKLERIAIGSPRSVPAGEYAMESMKKAGVARFLEKKLVMAKDVREALMYAERGEVDGAFVYRTDALLSKKVKVLFSVPRTLYSQVTYPMGLTKAGSGNRDAVAFFRYLQGEEAKMVLMNYGFGLK